MFKFVRVVSDFFGDVGFGVIKHSVKIVLGGGQAIVGFATNDEELTAKGLKNVGTSSVFLGANVIGKNINNRPDSEDESEDESEE